MKAFCYNNLMIFKFTHLIIVFVAGIFIIPFCYGEPPTPQNNQDLGAREFIDFYQQLEKNSGVALPKVQPPEFRMGEEKEARRTRYLQWIFAHSNELEKNRKVITRVARRTFSGVTENITRNPFGIPPLNQEWTANALIDKATIVTDSSLGDAQGGVVFENKIYLLEKDRGQSSTRGSERI